MTFKLERAFPSTANLSVVVEAVALTDHSGSGPAYPLNGVTDAGWWYQVGLSYNWQFTSGNASGFNAIHEVFDA